jgi:tRNA-binding protein
MVQRLPDVTPTEFFAVDMRVGRISTVEAFPEARKPAWKLTVDLGPDIGELRTSAQVTNYSEEQLVGRLVVAAINLGEKRIAGFTSQLLVLGAVADDGVVHLLEVPDHVEPGTRIA